MHNIAVINYYRYLYWLYTYISVEINIYSCKSSKPCREDMISISSFAFKVNAKTQLLSICGQTIALWHKVLKLHDMLTQFLRDSFSGLCP